MLFRSIEEQCKLGCHLTFYMARHSFATLICLGNGVPIETISRMMGHSSIRTTQIYAEITNQKVNRDLLRLADTTKNQYSLPDDKMTPRVYQCGRYNGWKEEEDGHFVVPECIEERKVAGILVVGKISDSNLLLLKNIGVPVVLVDFTSLCTPCDCVLTHNKQGSYMMTTHVINKGYQRIGFFGDLDYSFSFEDR